MIERQWRAVPGWEGHYEVSPEGLVRSLDRRLRGKFYAGRQLAPKRCHCLSDGVRVLRVYGGVLAAAAWRGFEMPQALELKRGDAVRSRGPSR